MPLEKNTGRLFVDQSLAVDYFPTQVSGNDNKLRRWHVIFINQDGHVIFTQVLGPSRRFLTRSIFGSEKPSLNKLSHAVSAWTNSTLMKVWIFWGGWVWVWGRFADLGLNVWHAVIKVDGNGVKGVDLHGWMVAPGINCSGKGQHFFCACQCVEGLVEDQIASIMMQGGHILCSICKQEAGIIKKSMIFVY